MRLTDGKLKNGDELGHSPPLYMQPVPTDLSSGSIRHQVFTWRQAADRGLDRSVINTETALEVSSWWAVPGNAFSEFTELGKIASGLKNEIGTEEVNTTYTISIESLQALGAYVDKSMAKEDK